MRGGDINLASELSTPVESFRELDMGPTSYFASLQASFQDSMPMPHSPRPLRRTTYMKIIFSLRGGMTQRHHLHFHESDPSHDVIDFGILPPRGS